MTPRHTGSVIMPDPFAGALKIANQIPFHDLHVINIVENLAARAVDHFAQRHCPIGAVANVMRVIDRGVELVANPDGSVSWHVTSKFPLYDNSGNCVGIIGCMRDFERSDNAWQPYRRMNAVVDHINRHYAEPIGMADLAKVASLSISQFERRFRIVFEQTPSRFLIRYRLTRASQILMHSDNTVSQIAQDVGFYDHSHFTREFQKLFGMAPGRYRKIHRSTGKSSNLSFAANTTD